MLAPLAEAVLNNTHIVQTLAIQSLVVVGLAIVASALWEFYRRHQKLVDVPVVNLTGWSFDAARRSYISDFASLIEEGYEKYPDQVFQLWSPEGYQVMLPARFVPVFQNMGHQQADLAAAVEERFVGTYKWTKFTSQVNNRAVYQDLNPRLGLLIDDMYDELLECLTETFGSSTEWQSVKLFDLFSNIITRVSSRVFVGKTICRNQQWTEASIQYTLDAFIGSAKLKQWSLPFRPFVALFLPETRRLRKFHALAQKLLVPTIRERYRLQQDPSYKKPTDMIQWIMDQSDKETVTPSPEVQAELQMLIGMAGIHTTTLTATHALLDLASKPEYLQPLRDEASAITQNANGRPQKKDLANLPLMDSFLKESQRLSPPDMITYDRVIKTPVTLSNGVHLPKNSRIGVPAAHISQSNASWPDAAQFQGFRFAHNKEEGKNGLQQRFVSTGPFQMHFGHGKHACPGRFFAAAELKLLFATLLLRFDVEMHEGQERPSNSAFGSMISAAPDAALWFRRRCDGDGV